MRAFLKRLRQTKPPRRRAERGIALLVVLSTLALVAAVVADFQFNSRIDLQLALNGRDELQAEYNALSALKLRALLLKHSLRLSDGLRSLATAFGADPSNVPPIAQLIEMVPVECGLMSAITKEVTRDPQGPTGDFFPGECSATSKSEHAKISLTALGAVASNQAQQAQSMLLGFLSDPKLDRYFQHDDKSGDHAESPLELVGAIVDWADVDRNESLTQMGDEDRYYSNLRDSYKAKNAPFDSIDELQLVHGVNDDLFRILRDQVTIYNPSPQIELATASDYAIALGVCAALRPGASCYDVWSSPAFWTALKGLRDFSAGLVPLTVASLRAALELAGLPVESTRLPQVFADKNSTTWYTIEAFGEVGNAKRRMRAVFQAQEGQFYYFRME